jgi:hypothetical protein
VTSKETTMTSKSVNDYEQDRGDIVAPRHGNVEEPAGRPVSQCTPLEEEIEVLEEQIAVLEEGLPQAPGMERAALAKEIAGYRRELEARQRALRNCRTSGASDEGV